MEKTERKLNTARTVLVAVFVAVLALLSILLIVLPKKAGELSPLEFRVLADHPIKGKDAAKLAEELANGRLSSNVDSFLEDHYPFRSFFIALDSYYTRLTGRNVDRSVIWGRNDRLFDAPVDHDTEQLRSNIDAIMSFADANGLSAVIIDVPSSATVDREDLPTLCKDYHDLDIIGEISASCSAYVPALVSQYIADEHSDRIYYRTDHHWTMYGAYVCYCDVARRLGVDPVPMSDFTVEGYDFFGSFYREAGLWLTKPDTLEIWRSPVLESALVTIGWGDRAKVYRGVYDPEKLKEDEVDKYAAYLYSNNGLTVIDNAAGNGKSLMIVKDSYGNSITPLFAMNYSTIIMIDTRYYDTSLPKPSELAALYGVKDIVVVMGTESMVSDCQLIFMR
ncbi:MAG: hypothetical protein J5586_00590 [Clostridia bacterium]|nr:hypothetical protein [Clostridia bacterium]